MSKYSREKRATYMRDWRSTPEGKAKISEYNKRVHRERWASFSAEEKREWNMKRKYGIGLEEAKQKLLNQDSCCACCKKQLIFEQAVVDHNHSTKSVRGMLCNSCNKAIGFVYEDKDTLKNMIDYLEKWDG